MEKRQRDTLDMTTGSPARVLLLFAVPIILSNLFQQLYNIIDSLIVGNYLGANALAAVGSVGTITAVIIQLASGLALGASVVISQYFGAGKKKEIRVCMTTICSFSVVVGAVVTVVTQAYAEQILVLVDTPEEIMAESMDYLTIYFWGSVAIFLYNALNAVYIALGDSRTPLYNTLIIHNRDDRGHVADVTYALSQAKVNVANMSLHRDAKGGSAIMIIETDERVPALILDLLRRLPGILHITYYEKED